MPTKRKAATKDSSRTMTDTFEIRNSTFVIPRALIEADREMPSDERRTPNRSFFTSTFEIHPSNFATALPAQIFYSTQIPVCLSFLAKNKAADAKRGFRDRRQQTLFINACKLGTLAYKTRARRRPSKTTRAFRVQKPCISEQTKGFSHWRPSETAWRPEFV
jgi:hypothetical protein